MAKKRIDDDSLDNFEDYGTGKFTGQNAMFDDNNEDNNEDHDEENEEDDNSSLNLADEDDAIQEKQQKPKKSVATIKPKLMGKHSLAHDNIFKGKKQAPPVNELIQEEYIIKQNNGSFEISEDNLEFEVSRNSIDYQRHLKLQQEIYRILSDSTDLKMDGTRRKPARSDLNNYFKILLVDLSGYTHVEIFVELSLYFSDNIWTVYTLLENKYKEIIIKDLSEKFGLSQIKKINFF